MDKRKTSKTDLESKRVVFIQVGLILALAVTLAAFEWRSYDRVEFDLGQRQAVESMEEIILNTQQEAKPPPPTPPPQTTILNIVEDDVEVDIDIEIDAEATQKTEIQAYVPITIEEEESGETEIFTVVEEAPGFPGGDVKRIQFLQDNIRYPQMARESGIQGTVYVTFVVERSGAVTDVRILRGIGGGCDEEAIRVIKAMPKWNPGKQRGKPVRVQFNMPIKFTLQG